jgi:fructose/tagatose bisphosphate aldolase
VITNLEYLKTAIEALEAGQSPMIAAKILGTMKFICEQNIERIQLELVDNVEARLYNTNTENTKER